MRALRHLSLVLTLISFTYSTDDREFPSFYEPPTVYNNGDTYHQTGSFGGTDGLDSAVAEARGTERCEFPGRWKGKWFQSGEGSDIPISITRTTITKKGRCLEADVLGDKYLIFSERESCYQCLVFHEKHANVLQYKQTYCISERRKLKQFCSSITGDAYLNTMFRLDAVPIECPFNNGPYTFTYNQGQKDCKNPASVVEPCIQSSRVQLNFQACPDVPGSESKSEELQCLATWREGSSRYLLGLIKYNHAASFEDRFRCFVYDNKTTEKFRLIQSGDATCNGLALNEFSRMMTLSKTRNPKPLCQFPSWLYHHTQWHTLDQRSTFVFDKNSGLRVYNSSDLSGVGPNLLTMTAMCSQIQEIPTLDKVTLILHSTAECNSGFICTKIYKRDGHIVEIKLGNTARKADDACHQHYFNESLLQYTTLVSSTPETRQCPNMGRFQVTSLSREGKLCRKNSIDSMSVGCNKLDTLQIQSECSDLSAEYACHGTWEEMGVSYLIATPLSRASTAARRYCFVFRESQSFRLSQQQRLKSTRGTSKYKFSNDDSNLLDSGDNLEYGRILQFSTIADSCRRNVIPGIQGAIAFNVTENGRCNDLSSGTGPHFQILSLPSYQSVILVLTVLLLCQ